MNQRADELLHMLWSKAVGTEDYDKDQWKELQQFIEKAVYGKGHPVGTELISTVIEAGTQISLCRPCYQLAGNKVR